MNCIFSNQIKIILISLGNCLCCSQMVISCGFFLLYGNHILTYCCILHDCLCHYCCELVLTQKKVAKHIIGKNGSRDLYRSPNHQYGNHMSCPYGGPVVHRQKTPPNMGRLGCVCQVLSSKGHDFSFQYW